MTFYRKTLRKEHKVINVSQTSFHTLSGYNADESVIDRKKRSDDLLEQAKANIISAQERQKRVYDQKHSNPHVFRKGGLVLKKDFTRKKRKGGKLDPKWLGPYKIVDSLGRGLYCLQEVCDPAKIVARVNGVHLKEYNVPSSKVRMFYHIL